MSYKVPDRFNEKQKEAVLSDEDCICVIGRPGSGKTTVAIERARRLIAEGKDPESIWVFTFTNDAADEVQERAGSDGIKASTFHSVAFELIRRFKDSNVSVYDEEDKKKVMKELDIEKEAKPYLKPWLETDDYWAEREEYLDYMKERKAYDFDMLIDEAVELTSQRRVQKQIHQEMDTVMVDEFQDIDPRQFDLLKNIVSNELFIIGDPNQSIYAFRGSKPEYLENFEQHFSGVKFIDLTTNYRSGQEILDYATSFMKDDHNLESPDDKDGQVRVLYAPNQEREAKRAVNLASKYDNYDETAILFRINGYSHAVEKALIKARIPYWIKTRLSMSQRAFIKSFGSLLQFKRNEDDNISLHRASNIIAGVGEKTVEQYMEDEENARTNKLQKVLDKVNLNVDPISIYNRIEDKLLEEASEEVREFIETFESSEDFIELFKLYTDKNKEREGITLGTIHSAKGLEWDHVIIIGAYDNMIPCQIHDDDTNFEEERRLFYVAVTRARETVDIIYPSYGGHGTSGKASPSRFIQEASKNNG